MPDDTVIDGEVIAFDDDGRPSFNALQNYGSATAPVIYYVFDVMVLAGRDVMREPLEKRRALLEQKILPKLSEPVRYASSLEAALPVLVQSVKEQGFEGLVAKRRNSVYEPGLRTGAWMKMPRQPRSGICDRRLHTRDKNVRCARVRVLRRRQADLRCENAERVYARDARAVVQEI
jgi:ATP-dependent DNA ligase